jgi:hypothetical protein
LALASGFNNEQISASRYAFPNNVDANIAQQA